MNTKHTDRDELIDALRVAYGELAVRKVELVDRGIETRILDGKIKQVLEALAKAKGENI